MVWYDQFVKDFQDTDHNTPFSTMMEAGAKGLVVGGAFGLAKNALKYQSATHLLSQTLRSSVLVGIDYVIIMQ